MNGLQQLKELALADSIRRHPTLPPAARYVKPYSDRSANGLTRAIIDFLRFNGFQAERVAVMGRPLDDRKVVTDVLGDMRRVGSIKWIPGTMQPGSADISSIIAGKSVKIEVKVGKDRQSSAQKEYQAQVERAGGIYLIVRSFEEFLKFYNELR